MAAARPKPLMRSLGEFFGHIVHAIRSDPDRTQVVRKETEEEDRGDVVLRRTTIEEVEFKKSDEATERRSDEGLREER